MRAPLTRRAALWPLLAILSLALAPSAKSQYGEPAAADPEDSELRAAELDELTLSPPEVLIRKVMQQRALKAVLHEQVELARLRKQLRELQQPSERRAAAEAVAAPVPMPLPAASGTTTLAPGDTPEDYLSTPKMLAFWRDDSGPVVAIAVPTADKSGRRIHHLRPGERLPAGTSMAGFSGRHNSFAVAHIDRLGVTLRVLPHHPQQPNTGVNPHEIHLPR